MMLFTLGGIFKSIISLFKTRVLNDGGTFEAETNLENQLNTLGSDLFNSASLVITPNGVKTSKLYTIKPNDGTGDLSVVRNTSATRIDENGNIVNVPANMARIDYSNGSPAILVEPQMTNIWTNNNNTNGYLNNPFAVKQNIVSDAFGNGFDGFEYNFNGGVEFISSLNSIRVFDTRTFPYQRLCLYIKNPSSDFFGINFLNVGEVIFKFSTLEVSNSTLGSIRKINDDTYALYIHNDNATMGQFSQVRVAFVTSLTSDTNVDGSAILGLGFFQQSSTVNTLPDVYGPIVTNTGAVTRNGDYIYRDGIEDLIGQTEGSIFCEFSVKYNRNWNSGIFVLRATSTTNERIALRFNSVPGRPSGGQLNLFIVAGGAQAVNLNSGLIPSPNQRYKVCATYNQTEQKIYINGVLVATRTGSYTQPGELTTVQLGGYGSSTVTNGNINMYNGLVFKTVLSDTEAINLTTL